MRVNGVSIPHRYGKNESLLTNYGEQIEFPFLIGTVRTSGANVVTKFFSAFPFLIGTVRTYFEGVGKLRNKVVSIPHRYGKNRIKISFKFLHRILFPFLIGTVRTIKKDLNLNIENEFPFLIGTVRTQSIDSRNYIINLFPFLIGTVRTKYPLVLYLSIYPFPFLIGTVRTFVWVKEVITVCCFHSS